MSTKAVVASQNIGTQLLLRYLAQLSAHPLRTKAATAGLLSFLQEILAAHIAGEPKKQPSKRAPFYAHLLASVRVDNNALKMAAYGGLVSAPMGHFLIGAMHKFFAGKTSTGAKIGQILAHNLLIAPIQTVVYLACMSLMNGGRSVQQVQATVKRGFWAVIKVSWMVTPIATTVAQRFIPPQLWVLYFNLIAFTLGTYMNTKVKRIRLAAERKAKKDAKGN